MPAFCTLADVKTALGFAVGNVVNDSMVNRMIRAASAWIETYLSRTILQEDYVDVLDGYGNARLFLPQRPVADVSSVVVDGRKLARSDFVFDQYGVVLRNGAVFPRGMLNVTVSYTAGLEEVPDDIVQATIDLVCHRFRELEHIGQASKATGNGETVSYITSEVPPAIKVVLQQYRNVVPV